MFLWLDKETAIYVRIGEGIKLSLRQIVEKLETAIETSVFNLEQLANMMDNEIDFIFTKDFYQFNQDSETFMETDSINLSVFTAIGKGEKVDGF